MDVPVHALWGAWNVEHGDDACHTGIPLDRQIYPVGSILRREVF